MNNHIPATTKKALKERDHELVDRIEELNNSGFLSRPIDKEILKRKDRDAMIMQLGAFTKEDQMMAGMRTFAEAIAIDGLPKNEDEVYEKRGWLIPTLLGCDQLFWGRWDYWLDILVKGTTKGSGPIPQIEWCQNPDQRHQVKKMLLDCLSYGHYEGATIHEFSEWLMWGYALTDRPPTVSKKVNNHWYRTFNADLMQRYPHDYFSGLLEEASSRGHQAALGYFSTPQSITQMMTEMVMHDRDDPERQKYSSFNEPCCGCGAMMLPVSNYTLFGSGQDINPTAVNLCMVQMMLYAPWFVSNPFWHEADK